MIDRNKILKFLDNQLKIKDIEDRSINGLQVDGKKQIERIMTSVDSDISTIKKSIELKADMLIVHHGLFWRNNETITDSLYEKISLLIKNGISLYAAHLPLDIHEEFGNNILIARALKLRNIARFGEFHNLMIGFFGETTEQSIRDFITFVEKALNTKAKAHIFSDKPVKVVGIISGAGGFAIKESLVYNIDTFVLGEATYPDLLLAKDLGVNVIECGHYETEVFGVRALATKLKEIFGYQVDAFFYDNVHNKNFHV